MTRYEEEILRRALHAAADRIEPAPDGLERIRARLSKPRPLAVAWLMVCWTGVAQPALLRMEPAVASLFERLGAWLRLGIKSPWAGAQAGGPSVWRPRAPAGPAAGAGHVHPATFDNCCPGNARYRVRV